MNRTKIENEVWQTIIKLNRLWTVENKAEELVHYFHKHMVAITPSDKFRREGQAQCVAGWKEFTDIAKIQYWEEFEPRIDLYNNGNCAVVTYRFKMSFTINNQPIAMSGRDMFTLINEEGKWWVVADQFSPTPEE